MAVLNEAEQTGFYDTYDPNQGQDSARYSIAADLETHHGNTTFTQQLFLIDRSVRIREDFTGFVIDAEAPPPGSAGHVTCSPVPGAPGAPPVCEDSRGSMLDLAMTEQSIGVRGSARTRVRASVPTTRLGCGMPASNVPKNSIKASCSSEKSRLSNSYPFVVVSRVNRLRGTTPR